MSIILEAEGLWKVYQHDILRRHVVTALQDVSLSAREGEIVAVLGVNGAGKSTLVKVLLGLVRPTAGNVRLFGADLRSPLWPPSVGYLPETFRVADSWSARDFLQFAGRLSGMQRSYLRERITAVTSLLQLTDVASRRASEFSKGMSVRLGIAQALLHEPRLLFLDEPTDGLDPLGKIAVRELLSELRRTGTSIIINSHLLSEVETIADRIAILHRGKLVALGSLRDLMPGDTTYTIEVPQDPLLSPGWVFRQHGKVWCSTVTGDHQLDLLLRALSARGITATNVVPTRTSLEDVFRSYIN